MGKRMQYKDITNHTVTTWIQGITMSIDLSSLGIYPKSIDGVDRTSWQEGWNECHSKTTITLCRYVDYLKSLRQEEARALLYLVHKELVFFKSKKNKPIEIYLLCNDTFYYACSDCEPITLQECTQVCQLYDKFDYEGIVAWISNKRDNQEPIKEYQTEPYNKAKLSL